MWQLLIQIFKNLLKQLELKLNLDLEKLKGVLCVFLFLQTLQQP
jgi:hypothetical protein